MPKLAPGPKELPIVGSLFSIRKNPLNFFARLQKKYGDVVHVKLGPLNVYLVSHPEGIKHVLQDNAKNYHKSPLYQRMKPVTGNGLLTSEGEFWQRQRKLAQPAFHQQKIAKMIATMAEEATKTLESWKSKSQQGSILDAQEEMMHLTGRIIVKTMFGNEFKEVALIEKAWNIVNNWIGARFWLLTNASAYLPLPKNIKFRKNLRLMEQFLEKTAKDRLQSNLHHEDLLSMLLEARDEETGSGMTNKQLRDEMVTIFLAGHETTAVSMGWTFYLLSQHPEIFQKLKEELKTVLGGKTPSFEDIPKLKYTRMVIEESMRIYPPVWGVGREALEDDEVLEYKIPKGSVVFLFQYVTHQREDLWENPKKFDPERFAPEKSKERHRFSYFPFGGGPRICIGNTFAIMETIIILATICQSCQFEFAGNLPVEINPLITLRAKHGIPMKVIFN